MAINLQKAEFILSAASPKDFLRDRLPQVAFSGRSNVGNPPSSTGCSTGRILPGWARRLARPPTSTTFDRRRLLPGGSPRLWLRQGVPGGEGPLGPPDGGVVRGQLLMTLGLMIVDARHKPTADDCTMAEFFRNSGRPFAVVANKLDKLRKSDIEPNLARIRETLELDESVKLIPFSAEKGDGKQELLNLILEHAEGSV